MSSGGLTGVLTRSCFRTLAFVFLTDGLLMEPPPICKEQIANSTVGRFQYLTILSLVLSLITIVLAQAADFAVTFNGSPFLTKYLIAIKRKFLVVSFSFETCVTILFWALFFYDDNLLVQKDGKTSNAELFPVRQNLELHLLPAIVLWVEYLVMFPSNALKFDTSDKATVLVAIVMYLFYTYFLKVVDGFWTYPILGLLNVYHKIGLAVGSFALNVSLFEAAHHFRRMIANANNLKAAPSNL